MAHEYAPVSRNCKDVNMDLNENPFALPVKLRDVMTKFTPNCYAPLSKSLIKKLSEYTNVNSENIFVGSGCDGLLRVVCESLIKKEDNVVLLSPYFPRTLFHLSKKTEKITIISPAWDYQYNIDELLKKDKIAALILSNPNNPTGYFLENNEIVKIIKNMKDSLIIIDEALMDYSNKESFKLVNNYDNVIILRSFSKNFGLAGMRIGFGCASKNLADLIKKNISPFEVTSLSQELAELILAETEYLENFVNNVRKGLQYIKKELNNLGIKYTDSKSLNLLVETKELGLDSEKTVIELKKNFINVTNASKYFALKEPYWIRVSLSTPENNMKFIKAITDLKNRQQQYLTSDSIVL